MLDDLRQEKPDQPLDPLSEGTSLPLSKKVALLCLAVALIGLFIFFTSDSWSSESKHDKHVKKHELVQEIEAIKARLTDLEMKMHPQVALPLATTPNETSMNTNLASDGGTTGSINLQSLIEQELQESHKEGSAKENEQVNGVHEDEIVTSEKKKAQVQTTAKKQQMYTVQKGDSLSKISQKVYGSPKYWKRIVEANKDKLGHSQTLRPGMTLVIPKEETKQ